MKAWLLVIAVSLVLPAYADLVPGIYHRNKVKVPSHGYYLLPADKPAREEWKLKTERTESLWEDSRTFIIPHRKPCAISEYTVMQNRFNWRYQCADKKLYEAAMGREKDRKIEFMDILEYDDASLALAEDKKAAKKLYLENSVPAAWLENGLSAPEGRQYFTSFWHDVRGPFRSVYRAGQRIGYETVSATSELTAYQNYFVGSPLSPCLDGKELTLYRSQTDGNFVCIEAEKFSRIMNISLVSLSEKFADRTGVSHLWVEGPDLAYCTKSARVEAAKLAQVGIVRLVKSEFPGRGGLLAEVDPDLKDQGNFPPIRVYAYEEGMVKGFLATYHGLLYGACQGHCKRQGYTVVLDDKGTVVKFLDSTLAQTSIEYDISEEGLERIRLLANNQGDKLAKLFAAGTEPTPQYSARMSQASLLWGAGNSVGTFLLHISLVREHLKLRGWPLYDWSKQR